MFEVGFSELLLISVLALIVLGPERLPKVAAQVGRWMGRARSMARQFREQLEDEVQLDATPKPRRASASAATGAASAAAAATAGGDPTPPSTGVDGSTDVSASEALPYAADAGVPGADAYGAHAGSAVDVDPDLQHHDYAGSAYTPPQPPVEDSVNVQATVDEQPRT